MLSSSFTWYDSLFWTFVILLVIFSYISYKHGYNMGFTEGRHAQRIEKKAEDDKAPEWATSVRIINRRKRY